MSLPDDAEPYGARLFAELKRLDILVSKLKYDAIESLMRANRDETARFFRASDDDVVQQIRTREPKEVVQYVVEKANRRQTRCVNSVWCVLRLNYMRYRLRTLLIVLALGSMVLASCGPKITRNTSSLIDDLSGVWTYPTEQEGDTTVKVVEGMNHTAYEYKQGRYSVYSRGEVVGQERVYFFQNEGSYYSPYFFVEHNGHKFLIINKHSYDKFIKTGRLEVQIVIRVADKLDFGKPPPRVSIETLGIPYDNIFETIKKENAASNATAPND